MLFNSLTFLIFFPIVTTIYFALPFKYQWLFLLISSCFFYMWFIPIYIIVLFITIIIDYSAGLYIEKYIGKKKKVFLIISILSTCLVLFIFKYFNFFNTNISELAQILNWNYSIKSLSLILPIGLSFHTFQSLSYVIEVYKGNQKAEKHFGIYALYVMFYPQLVAGPIERPQNMIHQFHIKHRFNYNDMCEGLQMMLWGLFKKVVIADRLALIVNQVYNNPTQYHGLPLIVATVSFAFQIYCDFSGYSDIARGAAKVMGYDLMQNFDRPYFSKSISEFWSRWHISLSTWFKDYLYIPLGGNRVSQVRIYINLLLVFLVSGLWHGANWTFVIWGLLHGIYLMFDKASKQYRQYLLNNIFKLKKSMMFIKIYQTLITFSLTTFAWIFFRANSLTDAIYIINNLFVDITDVFSIKSLLINTNIFEFLYVFFSVMLMLLIQLLGRKDSINFILLNKPKYVQWIFYFYLIFSILIMGVVNGNENQFIYFQF